MDFRISVILPTRNAAVHLEACLESLRLQTFRDFEVCVIDACSEDKTREVVSRYMDLPGMSLRFLSGIDSGVYEAMNKGVARARGEWLYFIGADDVLYDDDVFTEMVRFLCADDADIIYGDVVQRSDGRRYCGRSSWHRLILDRNICHQAIFYRKTVFQKLGNFDVKYRSWADWEFNIRCFRNIDIHTQWVDRKIAIYNNVTGISCQVDRELSARLPPKWARYLLGSIYWLRNLLARRSRGIFASPKLRLPIDRM